MKAYAKIFSVVLAIHVTLVAVEHSLGEDIDVVIARGFTVTSNTGILVARTVTVTSNIDSLVSRAVTATSNTDSTVVARAFTAVNCEEGAGGLCEDCNGNDIPDECEVDCGGDGGPCDLPECGKIVDCNGNDIPDQCEIDCNANGVPDDCDTIGNGDFDGDGDVDRDDYPAFADCMDGVDKEPQPPSPECINACLAAFDFEGDNDVDLIDFALFQVAFTGPR